MAITTRQLTRLSQGGTQSSLLRLACVAVASYTARASSYPLCQPPASSRLPWSGHPARSFSSSSCLREAASSTVQNSEEDDDERAEWVEKLKLSTSIPRDLVDITYTRSSGPGGQNVNKVSTKASVRLDLGRLRAGVPSMKLPPLPATGMKMLVQESPYYVASAHALGLSSSKTRSQDSNTEDALQKLHAHLLSVVSQSIRGKTSEEQKAKVRRLEASEKRKKEASKRKRSSVKGGRKKVIL